MHVFLVYPPFATLSGFPPTALSALSPYLRTLGFETTLRDLNVEFFHFLLDNWDELHDSLRKRIEQHLAAAAGLESRDRHLQRLLRIGMPIVDRLRVIRNHELLQSSLRDIVNDYFLKDILSDTNQLSVDLDELMSVIVRQTENRLLNGFLDHYGWHHADVIGLSIIAESQFPYALLIANWIRSLDAKIRLVAGGPYITEIHATLTTDRRIFDTFDYVVAHEGESALAAIVDGVETSAPVRHPNVFSRDTPLHETRHFHVEDIKSLPSQDFQGIDLEPYHPWKVALPVYSSKGCTWGRCTFCSRDYLQYREKEASHLAEVMLRSARDTGCMLFQVVDEDMRPSRLRKLSEQLIAHSSGGLEWSVQTRFYAELDRQILDIMARAGCYLIEFGLESASPVTLRRIRKGISLVQARRIISLCESVGINVILNCMIGFPKETEGDAEETLKFVDDILTRHPALQLSCNTQFVKIYANSDFGRQPHKYGIEGCYAYPLSPIVKWPLPDWVTKFAHRNRAHPVFTNEWSHRGLGHGLSDKADLPSDPWLSISKGWVHLPPQDPVVVAGNDRKWDPRSSHLVRANGHAWQVFRLNETMSVLASQLFESSYRLTELHEEFAGIFSHASREEASAVFGKALLRLNEIGAISFHAS